MNPLSRNERPEGMSDSQWQYFCDLMPNGSTELICAWPRELLDSFGTETQTAGSIRAHVAEWVMQNHPQPEGGVS